MLSSTQRNIELNPIDMHVVELVDIKDFVCKTTQNAILLYDTNTDAALVAHNDGTRDEVVEIRFVRGLSGITLVDNDSDVYSHVCKVEFVAGKDAIVTIKSHTPDEVVL